jgi:hypothetical protein
VQLDHSASSCHVLTLLVSSCAMYFGVLCEVAFLFHIGYLLIKIRITKAKKHDSKPTEQTSVEEGAKAEEDEVAKAEKDLSELVWSSIALVFICRLFAYFHYYLLYLPFNLAFYLHVSALLPLTGFVYPLVIWAMPYAGLSLSAMLDPLINPTSKNKSS